jgi:hypothetical protein
MRPQQEIDRVTGLVRLSQAQTPLRDTSTSTGRVP